MALTPMSQVVAIAEGGGGRITLPHSWGNADAAAMLVCRLFTDAVFSSDIYAIQTIVNRIDGGVPNDESQEDYRTLFGDCIAKVLASTSGDQLKVKPDDTVMDALCKSLYDMAVRDIYRDNEGRPRKPGTEAKRERDSAMRMILERTGGRKTKVEREHVAELVESADWISALPSGD